MVPKLRTQEIRHAQKGQLLFTPEQAQQMREHQTRFLERPGMQLRVTVRVYDAVNLSWATLSQAEREAEKIFLYAGIQIAWVAGPLSAAANVETPIETLRIWPRAAAGKIPTGSETLGLCLSLETGEAVVLADVVQERSMFGSTTFADLLGITMAHELGHLLLRSEKHSVKGVMSAPFTETALADDARGRLRFTTDEGKKMRNEVKRWMLKSER